MLDTAHRRHQRIRYVDERVKLPGYGLRRLETALEKTRLDPLAAILQSLGVRSLNHLDNLDTLHKIVLALEAKAEMHSQS